MNLCCPHPNQVSSFAEARFGIIKQPTMVVFSPPPSSTTTTRATSPLSPMATTSHHCRHHHPPPSLASYDDNSRYQPRGGNRRRCGKVPRCPDGDDACHHHRPQCEVSFPIPLPCLSLTPNAGATSPWVTWQPSH